MISSIVTILAVGLGGALGAVLRHEVARRVSIRFGDSLFGIFAVNVTGSFVIGIMAAMMLSSGEPPHAPALAWLLIVTGVLGSYTTVSSFSLQTLALLRKGKARAAIINVGASVLTCIGATAMGFSLTTVLT